MERIIFLCPHGAAKSVIAAALFNRMAAARGIGVRATSAGTDPDEAVPPAVVALLREEGIDVSGHRPERVTLAHLQGASRIISLGCDLDGLISSSPAVDRWDDVPPPSADPVRAREIIRQRLEPLLGQLVAGSEGVPG